MNKYPDNFRSEFHRVQTEYNAKKETIDKAKFERQAIKNQHLEHTVRKYQIIIPKEPEEIQHFVLNKYNWNEVVEKTEKLYKGI